VRASRAVLCRLPAHMRIVAAPDVCALLRAADAAGSTAQKLYENTHIALAGAWSCPRLWRESERPCREMVCVMPATCGTQAWYLWRSWHRRCVAPLRA